MQRFKRPGAVALLAVALCASIPAFAGKQATQETDEDPPASPCTDSVPRLPWQMFRHDICRTGTGARTLPQGKVGGTVPLKGTVSSSPAIALGYGKDGSLGLIFIAENKSDAAKLRAIQSTNGMFLWSADLGENANGTAFPLVSSPALSPDRKTVYVGTTSGLVFAFDANSGKEIWSFQTTDGTSNNIVVSSPVVSSDGKVLYISSIGQIAGFLWALDAKTGAEIWKDKDGTAYASPALSPDGKIVYVSSQRRISVLAFDATDGNFLWSSPRLEGTSLYSSPAVSPDGKVLYVGDDKNNVYAIDATAGGNGKQLWKAPLLPEGSVRSSSAVGVNGFIYVGSTNSNLYKIVAANGKLANSFRTGGAILSSPATTNSGFLVIVGSDDNKVYAIETLTMNEVWSVQTKGKVRSSPAIGNLADGGPFLVIVGSDDGVIYVHKVAIDRWVSSQAEASLTRYFLIQQLATG